MSKRQKIEAWAVAGPTGILRRVDLDYGKTYGFSDEHLVRLVPHDPRADAVVRAAVAVVRGGQIHITPESRRLIHAVELLEKKQ